MYTDSARIHASNFVSERDQRHTGELRNVDVDLVLVDSVLELLS